MVFVLLLSLFSFTSHTGPLSLHPLDIHVLFSKQTEQSQVTQTHVPQPFEANRKTVSADAVSAPSSSSRSRASSELKLGACVRDATEPEGQRGRERGRLAPQPHVCRLSAQQPALCYHIPPLFCSTLISLPSQYPFESHHTSTTTTT